MAEILDLKIEKVQSDPDQPRRYFDAEAMADLKAAVQKWGQLDPIRVRLEHGQHIIVDGERRWRTLRTLAKENPDDSRFSVVKAFLGDEYGGDAKSRKAIQLLANSGVDLAPGEKAAVIRELQEDGDQNLSDKALQKQFGISKGQLRYLSALAKAPEFLQQLGMPQKYEVAVLRDGDPVVEDGKPKRQTKDFPPLGISLLGELITLHNKLREIDASRFRESLGEHQPMATKETKRLGQQAQKSGWSKSQLHARCDAIYARLTNTPRSAGVDEISVTENLLQKLHNQIEKVVGSGETKVEGIGKMLRALLERIERVDKAPPLSAANG